MPHYHKIYNLKDDGNRKGAPATEFDYSFNGEGYTGTMDHREKVSTQGPGLREATSELTTRKNLIAQKYVPDSEHNKDKILEARDKVYGRLKENNKINLLKAQPRGWPEMGG